MKFQNIVDTDHISFQKQKQAQQSKNENGTRYRNSNMGSPAKNKAITFQNSEEKRFLT